MGKPLEEQTPEELRAYIQTLRQENKAARERNEIYDGAFLKLTPGEQRGFLHIVRTYADDPASAADLMTQLATTIAPTTQEEPVTSENTPHVPDPAPAGDEAPAWAAGLIAKIEAVETTLAQQQQAQVDAVEQQLRSKAAGLGYEDGSAEFKQLMDFAATGHANGDLDKAHQLMQAAGLAPAAEAPAPEEAPAAPANGEIGLAEMTEAATAHAAAASAGGTGSPAAGTGETGLNFKDKGEVRSAALAAMERMNSEGGTLAP